MANNSFQVGGVRIEIEAAPEIKLPSAADCNSPCWWSGGELRLLTATGHPVLNAGSGVEDLRRVGEITFTGWRDGGRWIESVHQEEDGTLFGWYHNEPAHLVPDSYQVGRQFPLTAPFIGAVVSHDNGATWDDLGLVLAGGPETLELEHHNFWFAGGNGDFTVILDRQREYFYFLIGTYYKDVAQQGVSLARMRYADLRCPVGKVFKWHAGGWDEPGLNGRVTPVLPVKSGWYDPNPDTFWGPSVHWNTHAQQYVILLNRAIDPGWKQEGVYACATPDIGDPNSWSEPVRILDTGGWYPELIGLGEGETDRELGREGRLFVHGESRWRVRVSG